MTDERYVHDYKQRKAQATGEINHIEVILKHHAVF